MVGGGWTRTAPIFGTTFAVFLLIAAGWFGVCAAAIGRGSRLGLWAWCTASLLLLYCCSTAGFGRLASVLLLAVAVVEVVVAALAHRELTAVRLGGLR